jgi:anti-anti-sigma factor
LGLYASSFSATLVHLDGNACIALVGELDLDSVSMLEDALNEFVESGPSQIILNCSGLSFICSSGLAVIIEMRNRLQSQGRYLILQSPRPNMIRFFQFVGLSDINFA